MKEETKETYAKYYDACEDNILLAHNQNQGDQCLS